MHVLFLSEEFSHSLGTKRKFLDRVFMSALEQTSCSFEVTAANYTQPRHGTGLPSTLRYIIITFSQSAFQEGKQGVLAWRSIRLSY